MRFVSVMIALALQPIVAETHHSRAEFSDEVIELEGQVVAVGWHNPHPVLTIKTVGGGGEEKHWKVESWQSANSLDRKGVPADLFEVGDFVSVAGQASLRRADIFLGTHIRLSNGMEAVLRPGQTPHWGGPVFAVDAGPNSERIDQAAQSANGIFRVWTYESRTVPAELPLTDAAIVGVAAFDELENHPQWRCEPEGMPLVMDSFYPIEFVDRGDTIELQLERTDAIRVIELNPDQQAAARSPSLLGYSTGRWEGDALIVTTQNISYPYFDDDGTPQSEALEIVEEFRPSADGTVLDWLATATDPQTFRQPVTISGRWVWVPGETIKPWNCDYVE